MDEAVARTASGAGAVAALLLTLVGCARLGFGTDTYELLCGGTCPASCTADPDCDDGEACNGVEVCDLQRHVCRAGSPALDWTRCGTDGVCQAQTCVPAGDACSLFVDGANGTTAGPGSATQPFSTIQAAVNAGGARLPNPTAVSVCVRAGTYGESPDIGGTATASAPFLLVALGAARIHAANLSGSFVELVGFEVTGGTGVSAAGNGIVVGGNDIHDVSGDGISTPPAAGCSGCRFVANVVSRPGGNGMSVFGSGTLVERNAIDNAGIGLLFGGTALEVTDNRVTDAQVCLQTWDTGGYPASTAVLLDRNSCRAVGTCLDAVGTGQGLSSDVTFADSVCDAGGDNGVAVAGIAGLRVVNSLFLGGITYNGVNLATGASGVIVNNIFVGNGGGAYSAYNWTGATPLADHNLVVTAAFPPSEAHGLYGLDPGFADTTNANVEGRYRLAAASPALDAGDNAFAADLDLDRLPRIVDSNGDGIAVVDLGPFERQ